MIGVIRNQDKSRIFSHEGAGKSCLAYERAVLKWMQNPKIITMELCPKQKTKQEAKSNEWKYFGFQKGPEVSSMYLSFIYAGGPYDLWTLYINVFFSDQDNHEMQFLYRPMPIQYCYFLIVVYYEHCVDVMLRIYLKLHESLSVLGYWLFVQFKLHTGVQNTAGK